MVQAFSSVHEHFDKVCFPRPTLMSASLFFFLATQLAYSQPTTTLPAWPAGQADRQSLPSERSIDYDFDNVEMDAIQGWLKWADIDIPINVSGRLSGWLWGQRSNKSWFDFKGYRVEGEIKSPKLVLDRWYVDKASVRFGYLNGLWYVGSLQGTIGSLAEDAGFGHVNASIKVPMDPQKQIEWLGTFDKIDLGRFLRSLNVPNSIVESDGTLTMSGTVPLTKANDLANWDATIQLDLRNVSVPNITPADLTVNAKIQGGKWTTDQGRIQWKEDVLQWEGNGSLDGDFPFRISFDGRQIAIGSLPRKLGWESAFQSWTGDIDLDGQLVGSSIRGLDDATVEIRSAAVFYQAQKLEAVQLEAQYQPDALRVLLRSASVAGGDVSGEASWSGLDRILQGIPNFAKLELQRIELKQVSKDIGDFPLSGVASGDLDFQSNRQAGKVTWGSRGQVTIEDFSPFNVGLKVAELKWSKALESPRLQARVVASKESIAADLGILLRDDDASKIRHTQFTGYRLQGTATDFGVKIPWSGNASKVIPMVTTGEFEIEGTSMEWFESGSAELSKVDLLVENQRLELQNAVLDFSPEEFRLSQFRLLDDHGRIAGSGIFRRQATGQNELNLRIAGVDIGPYATMLLPLEFATLQGNVVLEARLKKAASSSNFLHDWNGQIKGSLLNLRLRGVRIGELSGEAQLTENLLQTKLTGNILAGQAELNGTLPMTMLQWEGTPQPEASDQGFQFDAKLANVDLSRLISIASNARAGASYSGMASIESRGVVRGPSEFSVDANINIPLFKHQREEIAKELEANLSLEDGKLQILDMVGGVAGGRIQAQGSLNLDSIRSNAGELFFDAQRIQIDDLIGLVFPEYAHAFGGKVSYRGTVRLKDQFIVTGDARATKAHWYDLPIQNAHGDLRLAIDRNGALAGLSSRNVNGTAAGGNLLGSIEFPVHRTSERNGCKKPFAKWPAA